jgi:hypothetical protein
MIHLEAHTEKHCKDLQKIVIKTNLPENHAYQEKVSQFFSKLQILPLAKPRPFSGKILLHINRLRF